MKTDYQHACRHCRPRRTRSHHHIQPAEGIIDNLSEAMWMFVVLAAPVALSYFFVLSLVSPR